jgi:hypothetical protein
VLDTVNGATTDGTPIIQWSDQISASQQWQFVAVENGYYKLVNQQSGTVLDVPNASTSTGTQLRLGSNSTSTSQQWQLVDAGGGYFYLTNRNSGLNAEVSNASTADGAAIIQWTSNGGTNQQWQLLPIYGQSGSGSVPTPTPIPTGSPTPTSTPTPTPTPTSAPTPTPTVITSAGCKVTYTISSQWPGGFTANLTITNTSSTPLNGWTLTFTFPGSQQVTQLWNGNVTQSGSTVTITNASYNGQVQPGATVNPSPGFNGSWNGSNPVPTSFALNGQTC